MSSRQTHLYLETSQDASVFPTHVLHFPDILVLSGETESGSAGEQPDKG